MVDANAQQLDTSNRCKVVRDLGESGELLALFEPPAKGQRIARDEALVLAAWLVAMADPEFRRFPAIFAAVRGEQ